VYLHALIGHPEKVFMKKLLYFLLPMLLLACLGETKTENNPFFSKTIVSKFEDGTDKEISISKTTFSVKDSLKVGLKQEL